MFPDLKNPKDIFIFLEKPAIALAEFLTGALSSSATEYKLTAGRLIQAAVKNQLFTQFGREIKDYRDKGKIK
ncbi:MAG: hypothetical protein M1426_02160, partial [Patescibacteria group bacterium]|nr:hypothetical protein [Patescibacteria group bacterium]